MGKDVRCDHLDEFASVHCVALLAVVAYQQLKARGAALGYTVDWELYYSVTRAGHAYL